MKVTKRNGSTESVEFDKITKRLQNLISESDLKYLDPVKIAQKVINNLHDGINTTELDILSASICAHLCSEEPNYGLLGGRICVSNLHKMTPNTFYECVELLMQNHDKNNDSSPMLNNEIYNIIKNNHEKIESVIDTNRDYLIDFFGFKTLERAYLMKSNGVIVERPQYMWMRVAIGIHREDLDNANKTFQQDSTYSDAKREVEFGQNYGERGVDRSDREVVLKDVTGNEIGDKILLAALNDPGDGKYAQRGDDGADDLPDLVTLRIAGIQFRAYLKAFTHNVKPEFQNVEYVGRLTDVKLMSKFAVDFTLDFSVAALSARELEAMKKVSKSELQTVSA